MTDARRTRQARPLERHPHAPPPVRWIVRTLEEAGFEAWTVGGAVRDVLMGVPSMDWDLTTRATPRQIRKVFRRTVPIGIEHGTVGVLTRDGTMYEVTTFRKDVATDGRHAVVAFADRIEDDLARRDFTINAVAWHPLRDELYDPFGGVDDMEAGILRTVGRPADRFAEDYLRVLRALRFAGRYRLRVEPATWTALCAATPKLPTLSPERVREELMKILEKDEAPSAALSLWAASGALEVVLPPLDALVGDDGGADEPAPVDAWTRALLTADALPSSRSLLRLAAVLLDVGASDAVALMSRLRWSNAATDRVVGVVQAGTALPATGDGREGGPDAGVQRRRWLSRTGPERLRDVARVAAALARVQDRLGGGTSGRPGRRRTARRIRALRKELAAGPPLTVGDLALDGRDLMRLGLRPGPRFGEILEGLLERVLREPGLNERETLTRIVTEEMEAS